MAILLRDKGSHFDPEIMDIFEQISGDLFERFADRNDESVENCAIEVLNKYFGSFGRES